MKGWPVISMTSRARTIRRPLLGRIARRGLGVGGGEPGVQGAGAAQRRAPPPAGRGPRGRCRGTPGCRWPPRTYSPEPPTRTGERPSASSAVDLGAGQPLVLGDAGGLGDVPDVQQVVRDAAALLGRQLGGADVHAPVELHGVGVDDLAAEALGEGDAQIGLSGRGGADDGDDARGGGCAAHRPSLANPGAPPRTSYVTARVRGRCLLRGSAAGSRSRRPGRRNGRSGRRGISPARVAYGVDMGVFARLLRRSKATEEASTADEAPRPSRDGRPRRRSTARPTEVARRAEARGRADAAEHAGGRRPPEGVEIPKQQSADEAADSEAGEGART